MQVVIPLIFLITVFIIKFYINSKIIKKILYIYTITVGTILTLSTFNPIGLYPVSMYTYVLWIICSLSFIITIILVSITEKKSKKNEKLNGIIDINKYTKSKFLLIILGLNLLLLVYYKIKYESLISDLPTYQIRMIRYNGLFSGALETLFFEYIIVSIASIAAIIFAVLLVNKKIKNLLFWLAGLNVIIYTLIGYGRMMLFYIIIYIIITFVITYDIKKFIKLKNILMMISIIAIVFVFFVMSLYYRTKNSKLSMEENIMNTITKQFQQIIEYTNGGLRLLDNFINNGFEKFERNTLGRATLAGIEEIILYPIKGIGVEIDSFNNIISEVTQKSTAVGTNTPYFNAFYTCIMNFYLDFGIIGVILFPILYAIIMLQVINYYKKNQTLPSILLLNFVLMNWIFSIIRWNYQSGAITFVLILLIIWNIVTKCGKRNKFIEKGEVRDENFVDS